MKTRRKKQGAAVPYDDRPRNSSVPMGQYLVCPGSGISHPQQIYVQLMKGKTIYMHCPVSSCNVWVFFRSRSWEELKQMGLTRADIAKLNPSALIL